MSKKCENNRVVSEEESKTMPLNTEPKEGVFPARAQYYDAKI